MAVRGGGRVRGVRMGIEEVMGLRIQDIEGIFSLEGEIAEHQN